MAPVPHPSRLQMIFELFVMKPFRWVMWDLVDLKSSYNENGLTVTARKVGLVSCVGCFSM